jgi:hypothetical protein
MLKRLTVDQLKGLCVKHGVSHNGVKKKSDFLDRLATATNIDFEHVRSLFSVGKKRSVEGAPAPKEKENIASAVTPKPKVKVVRGGGAKMFRSACTVLRTQCAKCENCAVCGVTEKSKVVNVEACKDCAACLHTHDVFESIAEARGGENPIRNEMDVFYDPKIKKYVQVETQFVLGGEGFAHVIGKLRNGVVDNLTLDEIEICRSSGMRPVLPQNLDALITDEGDYIVEDNTESVNDVNKRVQSSAVADDDDDDDGEEEEEEEEYEEYGEEEDECEDDCE